MTTIKSLLDNVCAGGVLTVGDLAQVTRTSKRNVVRWRYRGATVRRDVEERLLELRAIVDLARRAMPDQRGAIVAAIPPARTRWPEATRSRLGGDGLPRDRRAERARGGQDGLTRPVRGRPGEDRQAPAGGARHNCGRCADRQRATAVSTTSSDSPR